MNEPSVVGGKIDLRIRFGLVGIRVGFRVEVRLSISILQTTESGTRREKGEHIRTGAIRPIARRHIVFHRFLSFKAQVSMQSEARRVRVRYPCP